MGKIGDQLHEDGLTSEQLLELFKNAQEALVRIVERANPDSPFRAYRVQQIRAIDKVLAKLQGQARRWTARQIPKLLRAGASEAEAKIREFKEQEFALEFAGVPESAVRVLTEDAFLEFGSTMTALRRDATRGLMNKRKLQEKIVESVIQGSSVARTQNQLIDILKKDGFTVLKAKNGFGRRFSLEHYTNLLVRTQSITAYTLGAKAQMTGLGRRYAKVPVLLPDIDGEDICNVKEREKYVDLLSKEPKNLPPFHPNCRHSLEPVSFAELKAERPDLYAKALAYFRESAE